MAKELLGDILNVRSKLDDENSKKLLLAIGEFSNKLATEIQENQSGYVFCLIAVSISLDDFPEGTAGFDQLGWGTANLILKRLDFDQFRLINSDPSNNSHHDSCFILYLGLVFNQFISLLENSDYNINTINQYFDILLRKKITSTKSDKWGDIDRSEWKSILNDFALEKLLGASFTSLARDMPKIIQMHAAACELDDLYGRFVEAVFNHQLHKRGNPSPAIDTGEDFELHIKNLIENNIPEARVETTPRTGDNGADLLVYISGISIAIQAKYYSDSVGNSAVQEIYSAKSIYKSDHALVVTNSSYTMPAQEAASALNVILTTEANLIDVIKYLIEH